VGVSTRAAAGLSLWERLGVFEVAELALPNMKHEKGAARARGPWAHLGSIRPPAKLAVPGARDGRTIVRTRMEEWLRQGPNKRMTPSQRVKCHQTRYPDPKSSKSTKSGQVQTLAR
jgi:hypothetical protein